MKNIKFNYILIVVVILSCFNSFSYSQTGWKDTIIGTRNYVSVNFINESTGFIFGNDKTLLKTTNEGRTWQLTTFILPFPVLKGVAINEYYLYILGGNSGSMVQASSNGGLNWTDGQSSFIPIGNGVSVLRNLIFLNQSTGYVCGTEYGLINGLFYVDGIIYKTTNSGVNWFLSLRGGVDYLDIKFKDENTGYAVLGGVIKTSDSGSQWNYAGAVFSQTFSLSHPFNDTLYMSSTNGNVHKSINGGVNWETINTTSHDSLLNIFFVNSKVGYSVGTEGAIVKTVNAGENWVIQQSHTTQQLNSIYMINKDTGFIVGNGGVILKTTNGGLTGLTSHSSEIPSDYELYQNYPNPFNPVTNIGYSVSRSGFVSIKVYDVLGNEVAVLVNEIQKPGYYDIEFSASERGNNIGSGVYFYRLETKGISVTKRMILLK